jgi:putative nucleotidyltransferase with HDIG domain
MITRDQALELVTAQNPEPHMILHARQSEAVMRALAGRLGQDRDLWGLAGLVHDLDYPRTKDAPERHGLESAEMLAGKLPEEAVRAIKAHNGEMTGTMPVSAFDYGLRCAETVTGMIHAAALMRPTGYEGLEVKSVKKKMKDKAFARAVRRENILECEKAGVPLDEFLGLAIEAMRGVEA